MHIRPTLHTPSGHFTDMWRRKVPNHTRLFAQHTDTKPDPPELQKKRPWVPSGQLEVDAAQVDTAREVLQLVQPVDLVACREASGCPPKHPHLLHPDCAETNDSGCLALPSVGAHR